MLRSDIDGRSSFAIVALAILLLANLSAVYMLQIQREEAVIAAQAAEIEAMREVSSLAHKQVQIAAHYLAKAAIREATQGAGNQTQINEIFTSAFSESLGRLFPCEARGFTVSVGEYELAVLTESKVVEEVLRTGTVVVGNGSGRYGEAVDNGLPGREERSERIVYYRLAGRVNYTVSRGTTTLETTEEVADELDSPFPFISQQLNRFSLIADGAISDMGQALRYILTTIAQYRVFLGYAGGEYLGNTMSTFDILTPRDVELAVNLVLILEQVRHFRSYDPTAVDAIDASFSLRAGVDGDENLTPSAADRTLSRLLDTFAGTGTIDPADIFVLFTALDEKQLPMNRVLAQVLYAIADQLVLKYMDYVSLLPVESFLDLGLRVLETIGNCWNDFMEWVSGNSREAQMVREYVDNLFREMGTKPEVLGPVTLELPDLVFTVANADGSLHNVSLQAGPREFPFGSRTLTEGNKDLWESYYSRLFGEDLREIHSGVRDLAQDIASKVANEFEGTGLFEPITANGRIDPKDTNAFLEYVEGRITASLDRALMTLKDDPLLSLKLLESLWDKERALIRALLSYIEDHYESIASPLWYQTLGVFTIQSTLLEAAAKREEFRELDSVGRDDLSRQVALAVVQNGLGLAAYNSSKARDIARFEAVFARATSIDTPPEGGGLYQRSMSVISGTEGFLATAGDFMRRMLGELARNEEVSGNRILVPALTGPFKFSDATNDADSDQWAASEESLIVDQNPDLLSTTQLIRDRGGIGGTPSAGELWIALIDPSSVPAAKDSPNVHYTRIDSVTDRPFETQWSITVKGAVIVNITTSRGIFLDPAGHVPATDERVVTLDTELAVKVFSGWPLAGVDYVSSNTLASDVWNAIQDFLSWAWDGLARVFGWALDIAKNLAKQISHLLDYLVSRASQVIETIYSSIEKAIDLARDAVRNAVSDVLEALAFIIEHLPHFDFSFSRFGLTLQIGVNEPGPEKVLVSVGVGSFSLRLRFMHLTEAGYRLPADSPEWDMLADWHASLWKFSTDGEFDPLMIVGEHIVEGTASWSDSWRLRFTVPEVEVYYDESWSVATPPIQTPFGDLEFEVGVSARLTDEIEEIDISSLIAGAFQDAGQLCGGIPRSWDSLGKFAGDFARSLVNRILFEIEGQIEHVIDVTFYVAGEFRAGDVAGAGLRLSLSIDGEGVLGLFRWLAHNIRTILDHLLDPMSSAALEELPSDLPSHVYVSLDFVSSIGPPSFISDVLSGEYELELRLVFGISATASFIGALVGLDWGPWEIRFGACLEGIPAAFVNGGYEEGQLADVWLISGSLTMA